MITIAVETDEERQAAERALQSGVFSNARGQTFTVRIEWPRGGGEFTQELHE